MGLAWIIGFAIYFMKRYKRKKRNQAIAAGEVVAVKDEAPTVPEEKIIIPPDPAVLLGHRVPGEYVFPERESSERKHRVRSLLSRSNTDKTHPHRTEPGRIETVATAGPSIPSQINQESVSEEMSISPSHKL